MLIACDPEPTLEDGTKIEVLAGTITDPGDELASGELRDPLGGTGRTVRRIT